MRTLHFASSVVVSFLLTPYVISSLGDRAYGLWLFIAAFIGYYGLFDLGLSTAVSRHFAAALARDDRAECTRIFGTAIQYYFVLGGLVFGATCLFGALSGFIASATDAALFSRVILILGTNVALLFVLKPYLGVLQALGRFDIMAALEILTLVIRTTLIVIVLANGQGIVALALVTFLANLPRLTIGVLVARRLASVRWVRQPLRSATSGTLFGYSFYMLVAKLADELRFNSDAMVIGTILGLTFVTPYGIANSLITNFRAGMMSLLGVLQPTYTRLSEQGQHEQVKRTLFFGTKVAMCTATFIGFGLIAWGRPFIAAWVGSGYAAAYPCLVVLALGWTINFWQSPGVSLMYATGRHKFYAATNVAEALANLLLSLWWVREFGILGVALGTAIPMAIVRLGLQPYYMCRVMGIPGAEYRQMFFGNILRTAIALCPAVLIASAIRPAGFRDVFVFGALAAIVYGTGIWFLLFSDEERGRLIALVPALARRRNPLTSSVVGMRAQR